MKVAVTGASGFLGRYLVRALAAAGHDVVAVARDAGRAAGLDAEIRAADLADPEGLARAFAGCDAMVANAALAPGWSKPADGAFTDANVVGAQNHLDAAQRAGLGRIVWISTVAVYRTSLRRALDESAPLIDPENPVFDWNQLTTDARYARSKAVAERLARERAHAAGLALTVLRPGPIYGPGDPKLTARYARMLGWPVAPAPTARLPHVHAADVADAVARALGAPHSVGRAYNLAGESVSPAAFLRAWRDAQGGRARILPVPLPFTVAFDDAAARRDLGFAPRAVADAVREMPLPESSRRG